MKTYYIGLTIWAMAVAFVFTFAATSLNLTLCESFADKVARKVVHDIQVSIVDRGNIGTTQEAFIAEDFDSVGVAHPYSVPLYCEFFENFKTFGIKPVDSHFKAFNSRVFPHAHFDFPNVKGGKRRTDCGDNCGEKRQKNSNPIFHNTPEISASL